MPHHHYRLYGMSVRADQPLPPLPPAPPAAPEVEVELVGRGLWPAPPGAPHLALGPLSAWRPAGGVELRYRFAAGQLALQITADGARVRAGWGDGIDPADVVPFLLGPGLGAALRLRGVSCLHGAAAIVPAGAVVIIGASGAGKSTTVAALLRAGWPLLADDIAALDEAAGRFQVRPGYPALRVAAANTAPLAALASGIYPLWSDPELDERRRYVDLAGTAAYAPAPAPLAAIYLLAPRVPGAPRATLTRLTPREALPELMANLYTQRMLLPHERADSFAFCARLAAAAPVSRVAAPDDLARLPQLVADLAAHSSAGAP